jgi:hypothetical protein
MAEGTAESAEDRQHSEHSNRSGRRGPLRLVWVAYQQVAGVMGAFALLVFLGEVFHLGWRGILNSLVGVWSEYIRPIVKWMADGIVWPFEWAFNWHIEIPLVVRDYFAVGLVFLFSLARAFWKAPRRRTRPRSQTFNRRSSTDRSDDLTSAPPSSVLRILLEILTAFLALFLFVTLLWPIAVLLSVLIVSVYLLAIRADPATRSRSIHRLFPTLVRALLPLIYLALLLAVNFALL